MTAHPTATYQIRWNGSLLHGYAQGEDIPLDFRVGQLPIIGSDGGFAPQRNAEFRNISLSMRVLSRVVGSGTGYQNLADCKNQWREDLAVLTRITGPASLQIGETDRYILATFAGSSAPISLQDKEALTYDMKFIGNPPWFLGTTVSSSTGVGGPRNITLSIGETRKTYPTFTVASGITHVTLDHSTSGKSLTMSGSHAAPWQIDCGTLQISSNGLNAFTALTSVPNFGMHHTGAGTFTVAASQVVGSGTIGIQMTPRYER
jgi:hypothetical protein